MPSTGGCHEYQTVDSIPNGGSPGSAVAPPSESPARVPSAPVSAIASAKLSFIGDGVGTRKKTPDFPAKPSTAIR